MKKKVVTVVFERYVGDLKSRKTIVCVSDVEFFPGEFDQECVKVGIDPELITFILKKTKVLPYPDMAD